MASACRRYAAASPGLPSRRWLLPIPSRARASSGTAPRSRAMASARVCWSRAWPVAEVRVESSPRRFSASAWPSLLPRSRNISRARWWLAAAVGATIPMAATAPSPGGICPGMARWPPVISLHFAPGHPTNHAVAGAPLPACGSAVADFETGRRRGHHRGGAEVIHQVDVEGAAVGRGAGEADRVVVDEVLAVKAAPEPLLQVPGERRHAG